MSSFTPPLGQPPPLPPQHQNLCNSFGLMPSSQPPGTPPPSMLPGAPYPLAPGPSSPPNYPLAPIIAQGPGFISPSIFSGPNPFPHLILLSSCAQPSTPSGTPPPPTATPPTPPLPSIPPSLLPQPPMPPLPSSSFTGTPPPGTPPLITAQHQQQQQQKRSQRATAKGTKRGVSPPPSKVQCIVEDTAEPLREATSIISEAKQYALSTIPKLFNIHNVKKNNNNNNNNNIYIAPTRNYTIPRHLLRKKGDWWLLLSYT